MPDIEEIVEKEEVDESKEVDEVVDEAKDVEKKEEVCDDIPVYFKSFIDKHLKDLTQIYIKERKEKKMYGILLLEGNLKDEKMDVGFLPEINIEPDMLKGFKSRNVNGRIMHIMCHDVEKLGKHYVIERVL